MKPQKGVYKKFVAGMNCLEVIEILLGYSDKPTVEISEKSMDGFYALVSKRDTFSTVFLAGEK